MIRRRQDRNTEPEFEIQKSLYFGLDLGSRQDYSALCAVECVRKITSSGEGDEVLQLNCNHLQRWQLRTGYPTIVADVVKMINNLDPFTVAKVKPTLSIDGTGVGVAVMDLFRQEKINADFRPIIITGGNTVNIKSDVTNVPKKDLIGSVMVALEKRKLNISDALPEMPILTAEFENFNAKTTLAGNDTFGAGSDWRVGNNDDLVLALSLAIWTASLPPLRVTETERQIFNRMNY